MVYKINDDKQKNSSISRLANNQKRSFAIKLLTDFGTQLKLTGNCL